MPGLEIPSLESTLAIDPSSGSFSRPVLDRLLSWTMLTSSVTFHPHQTPLGWLAVGLIFAAFGQILDRGVTMRAELDTVI